MPSQARYWVARLILLIGYGIIIGVVAHLTYIHFVIITALLLSIFSVLGIWIAIAWIFIAFMWAHRNWRKK